MGGRMLPGIVATILAVGGLGMVGTAAAKPGTTAQTCTVVQGLPGGLWITLTGPGSDRACVELMKQPDSGQGTFLIDRHGILPSRARTVCWVTGGGGSATVSILQGGRHMYAVAAVNLCTFLFTGA